MSGEGVGADQQAEEDAHSFGRSTQNADSSTIVSASVSTVDTNAMNTASAASTRSSLVSRPAIRDQRLRSCPGMHLTLDVASPTGISLDADPATRWVSA